MKVVLAGFGLEGQASYEYWNRGDNELTIADERQVVNGLPAEAKTILGPTALSQLEDYDLIVRSPGINPKKLPYGNKVWSATNEFFDKCPADIIGVTGTKGKGTTCSLIASILTAAGRTVHLVGNIGTPALAVLANIKPDDVVVYELSSFQLWDAKRSPQVAVVLMIEPDHLDVHDDMDDYLEAKGNITRYQNSAEECAYYRPGDKNSEWVALSGVRYHHDEIDYGPVVMPYVADEDVHVAHDVFMYSNEVICNTNELRIKGAHNVENACAAIAASRKFSNVTWNNVKIGLNAFEGLPHRLKFVTEKYGVKYYDDSIATAPGSAIAALMSFEEAKVIILGGHDKGADYTELIETCGAVDATVIAIGSNGPAIARLCREENVTCVEETGDMKAIVARAADIAGQGSVVILSPAAASFDMFESYADRGDQFVAALNSL